MAFIKMSVCALVALTVVVVSAQTPYFCTRPNNDCPSYTSQKKTGYEVRSYPETKWATTSITASSPDLGPDDSSAMFRKLFNYIRAEQIDMTAPVLTKVKKVNNREYRITMMFYIPPSVFAPTPSASSGVTLQTKPAGDVFVKTFTKIWWATDEDYNRNFEFLKTAIGSPSAYNSDVHFRAGYDSPRITFRPRVSEVWMDKLN